MTPRTFRSAHARRRPAGWVAVGFAVAAALACTDGTDGDTPLRSGWGPPVRVSAVGGWARLPVRVPKGADAVAVLVETPDDDVAVMVASWNGGGTIWVDEDAGVTATEAQRAQVLGATVGYSGLCGVVPGFGAAVFACPNGDGPALEPGLHDLLLYAWRRQRLDGGGHADQPADGVLTARFRLGVTPAPETEQAWTVRLHVPNGAGLDTDGEANAAYQRTLATARALLQPLGIRPVVDLRAGLARSQLVVAEGSLRSPALMDLVAECEEGEGVDVFVLEALEVEGADGLLRAVPALVTSLPVAAGTRTVAAPVILSGHWRDNDPSADARLGVRLAHELGHALGLFHLREADASDGSHVEDRLEDTPADPLELPGWLMHRVPLEQSQRVSDGQRAVVQRSPMLR
jgi:hypothetical protein